MQLKDIIDEINKRGLTAYEIAKVTPLTEVGINKILNGHSKKPHKSTLAILENYLYSTIPNVQPSPNSNFAVGSQNITNSELLELVIDRLEEIRKHRLYKLLIENEILKRQLKNIK